MNAYNQPEVMRYFLVRLGGSRRIIAAVAMSVFWALFGVIQAHGQLGTSADDDAQADSSGHGRVVLVLPFDNRTGEPNLEWIREAASEVLSTRFASAGFEPTSRTDRVYALDHLGLPQGFQPSRASALKLAQTLDADSIVVGSYTTDGTGIVAQATLVDVPHLRMMQEVSTRGEMRDLIAVFSDLAWKLTRQMDPTFAVAEQTFAAAGNGIPVTAYEQYIRGISESDQAERLMHLQQAVRISPDFGRAWMALGREDYNGQQYQDAAAAFAKVDRNGTDGLEADFYRGLALLFSGDYVHAEGAFAEVARVLPLAEVVNNEGVSASRQGHDGTSLFIQAAAADPNGADYHFNLAVSLKRHGNTAGALNELAQCLKLRPGDSEAQTLQDAWKRPASGDAEGGTDPLERIERTFNDAAFKQAASMMDEVNEGRMAVMRPRERAKALCTQAKGYLDRGLLLEAERLYQSAVAADGNTAEAHAGLAQVRERTGDTDAARREATAALEIDPGSLPAQDVMKEIAAKAGKTQ